MPSWPRGSLLLTQLPLGFPFLPAQQLLGCRQTLGRRVPARGEEQGATQPARGRMSPRSQGAPTRRPAHPSAPHICPSHEQVPVRTWTRQCCLCSVLSTVAARGCHHGGRLWSGAPSCAHTHKQVLAEGRGGSWPQRVHSHSSSIFPLPDRAHPTPLVLAAPRLSGGHQPGRGV